MSSREPANPIASGRTADVHPWGEGRVLKLYRPGTSPRTVESEQRKTSAAHAIGLPVPAVGSRIELDGRLGLVLERVDGLSMMETVLRDPDTIEPMALRLAEVHLDLHAHEGSPGLHDQRTLLREKIARCAPLSQAEREAVLGAMARLPGGDRLCHGDFHPANVILTDRDPVIIDWIDASRGNPLADVARTALILLGYVENTVPDDGPIAAMKRFHRTYLDGYMQRVPEGWAEYQRWLPIVAAARLSDGIVEQQEWLLEQVRSGLAASEPPPA